jgi:hypothetical protein
MRTQKGPYCDGKACRAEVPLWCALILRRSSEQIRFCHAGLQTTATSRVADTHRHKPAFVFCHALRTLKSEQVDTCGAGLQFCKGKLVERRGRKASGLRR